ncbi:hypothetical protein Vadar_018082 [Vaccinium darrowii]|uniref:Uncharacterized protein n=1 Tax=Vaccinium darrowii TaxID=229202 RepID=A0ACB7XAJ9_9ERIC|nr:hypothetical protein Vadar_018082 [Vaccinium darrowii]
MSHSLHRTTDGIPGSNQFLDQPSSTETIKPWEFNAGLEQHRVKQEGQHEDPSLPSPSVLDKLDIYKAKRSKSSHWSPEYEIPTQCPRDIVVRLAGEEFKRGSTGTVHSRARSFHTVEEYDAMVENIQLVREPITRLQDSKWSSKKSHHPDYYPSKNLMTAETGFLLTSGPGTREMPPTLNTSSPFEKSITFEDDPHEGSSSISGKGLKRKAIAKGLNSIQVPSITESPSVASLREWLYQGGQVYSPGAYVTPKFGSYNLPNPRQRKECSEEPIFDPNLLAAFEECMLHLDEEEDTILRGIEQVLEKDPANETETEEYSSSNTLLDPR